MELVTKKTLQLYSGTAHPALSQEIASHLRMELGEPNIRRFSNGEMHCRFDESVRGADVFIIQTHHAVDGTSVNDAIFEQLIMIDAAKRGSAKRITAVCPYYGYSRQDRKAEGREPIAAKLVADLMTAAGVSRMMSVDLHSGQIQGFFDKPVDHLIAMPVLLDYIRNECGDDLVVVSPDAGRIKVAERYSQALGADLAFVHKRHVKGKANSVEARGVIGEVSGRRCILIDDMIDTAGTIVAAADILADHGATEVWAMATHGLLSDPALERLSSSKIARTVITNTVPLPAHKQLPNMEVLSVSKIIADAIDAVFEDTSVSEIFGGENQS